jgi:hypothetical protein
MRQYPNFFLGIVTGKKHPGSFFGWHEGVARIHSLQCFIGIWHLCRKSKANKIIIRLSKLNSTVNSNTSMIPAVDLVFYRIVFLFERPEIH